jgi:hypothetical protein
LHNSFHAVNDRFRSTREYWVSLLAKGAFGCGAGDKDDNENDKKMTFVDSLRVHRLGFPAI